MSGTNFVTAAQAEEWDGEFIMDYGQTDSLLPARCNQSGWLSGSGTAHFTIVQNDQITTTRGANGDIIYRNGNQATISVTLQEALGAEDIDNFAAFQSSVDQREIMYQRVEGAVHRKMDDLVLTELDGTPNTMTSSTLPGGSGGIGFQLTQQNASEVAATYHSLTVGDVGDATGIVTIRAFMSLLNSTKVSSRDYSDDMPLQKGFKPFRHAGILWIPYARAALTGVTTNSAHCYVFSSQAVAFKEAGDVSLIVDFDKKNRKWFCNAQEWCAAKRLLDDGVVRFLHDDTVIIPA